MGQVVEKLERGTVMSRMDMEKEEARILNRRGYEVVRTLGEGAFSRVLLVRERMDPSAQTLNPPMTIACKICHQSKLGLQEGRLLQRMDHPLFPRFLGMWQEGETVFLLMEAVFGSSLEALLKRRGALTERQTARIGMELAVGLKYLHELPEPVLFRDVKPANILIRQDGRIKLLDLGCACRLGERAQSLAGTPGYGAPEQLEAGHVLTAACDVYGLGRTLREAVGEDCKKSIGRVLDACTQIKTEIRIQDMREVLAQLEPFAGEGSKGRMFGRKDGLKTNIICVKNIWESHHKNT